MYVQLGHLHELWLEFLVRTKHIIMRTLLMMLVLTSFADRLLTSVWMVTAETPSLQLREKSIMVATFTGFCVSVLVSFVSPFIQADDAGALGARIGYVFAAISVIATVWTFFFLPETGSRSLEELDELFQNQVSVWKFKRYQTHGYGAQLAIIEGCTPVEDGLKAQAITVRIKDQVSMASVTS